ncbi:MAG: hypothetical protein COT15_03195 [Candidatus Diapherotrites archaeon CG08_land_8_20_14_0_20_34_12]|nr:MAG: hypothetical protein COT15_03195 [Candidatus Diapherotrites archaeon CG08_land_8_20_14_0_20_34_12]
MIGEKILEEKFVCLPQVKELLKDRKVEDKEPTYEQAGSTKYVKQFAKVTDKQAEKLMEELMKLEGMTQELAVKVVDLLPKDKEIVKAMMKKGETISDDNVTKILELTEKYLK